MNTLLPLLICILCFSAELANLPLCPKWKFTLKKKQQNPNNMEWAAEIKEKNPGHINKLSFLNKE